MDRRRFIGSCLVVGATMGLRNINAFAEGVSNSQFAVQGQFTGLTIADPHAHPYQLHNSRKSDSTAPAVELMERVNMRVCSFAAVGDMVKYPGRSGSPYADTRNQLQTVVQLRDERKVRLILKSADLQVVDTGGISVGAIMAIEGGDAFEGDLKNLDAFHDLGVRMITLLHDHDNEIGCNQRSTQDGPLTSFGAKVVERMNQSKMIIDVAHAKTKTLKSIAEVSKAPLIDSHTNPLPVGYTPVEPTRMRTWPEMETIAKTGGMICTWPLAYTREFQQRTTFKHWAEEILLMKTRLGIEHCGLGTDSGGGLPQRIQGWDSYASLPKLVTAMKEVGLSQHDIALYLGGNFLRLLNTCLG